MGNMTSSHSADDPEPMDTKEAEVSCLVLVVNLIWDYYQMCDLPVDFGMFSTLGELQVLVVVCIFCGDLVYLQDSDSVIVFVNPDVCVVAKWYYVSIVLIVLVVMC